MNDNNQMRVSGPSFEELTLAEMHSIQGSGDVQAESTPLWGYAVGHGIGIWVSLGHC